MTPNLQAAALVTLLIVIAINLAIGILPHVDNFAHIGGFLTGFLLGFVLLMRPHYGWMQRYVLPSDVKYTSKKYLVYQWIPWLRSSLSSGEHPITSHAGRCLHFLKPNTLMLVLYSLIS